MGSRRSARGNIRAGSTWSKRCRKPRLERSSATSCARAKRSIEMTLSPTGSLRIGASDLEYRFIGPAPDTAPTIVMLHEGLGSVGLWGDFPEKLQAATGCGV